MTDVVCNAQAVSSAHFTHQASCTGTSICSPMLTSISAQSSLKPKCKLHTEKLQEEKQDMTHSESTD